MDYNDLIVLTSIWRRIASNSSTENRIPMLHYLGLDDNSEYGTCYAVLLHEIVVPSIIPSDGIYANPAGYREKIYIHSVLKNTSRL